MDEQKEVVGKITSVKADDFKRCHVTGFYGGINPHNELVFEIIEDVTNLVGEFELIKIPGQPHLIEQKVGPNTLSIKRIRHAEITMPLSTISSIITWLQDKQNEYEKSIADQELSDKQA